MFKKHLNFTNDYRKAYFYRIVTITAALAMLVMLYQQLITFENIALLFNEIGIYYDYHLQNNSLALYLEFVFDEVEDVLVFLGSKLKVIATAFIGGFKGLSF